MTMINDTIAFGVLPFLNPPIVAPKKKKANDNMNNAKDISENINILKSLLVIIYKIELISNKNNDIMNNNKHCAITLY